MHDRSSTSIEPEARNPAPPVPPERGPRELIRLWLAAQPLVVPAVGMASGIALDAAWALPAFISIALLAGGLILIIRSQGRPLVGHLGVFLTALAAGAPLHDRAFRRVTHDHVGFYCDDLPLPVRLTGTVLQTPTIRPARMGRIPWYSESPHSRLLLAAESLDGLNAPIPTSGVVAVNVREPVLHVAPGDRVSILGKLHRPIPPDHPGARDWAKVNRRRGVLAQMSCKLSANVKVISPASGNGHQLTRLRTRLRAALLDDTFVRDVPGASLLSAMVLGQRSAVDAEINQAFVDTGTVHYLSVSGAHVGMLASAVWLIGWLIGAPRRKCAWWTLAIVTLYAVAAEPRPPIIRAAVMADLLCLAIILRRPVRSANWLALAAIVLLIFDPNQLFNAGFQLSFATVIAVIYLSPRLRNAVFRALLRIRGRDDPLLSPEVQRLINPPSRARRAGHAIGNCIGWLFAVSASAWLVGTLLGAYHFGQLPLWGWFNSVLVMPLVWVTLVLGFGKTVLHVVTPSVANLLAGPVAKLTELLVWLVQRLADLPGAGMPAPKLPGWLIAVGLLIILLMMVGPLLRIRRRWLVAAPAGWLALAAILVAPPGATGAFRIHLLPVGGATACVIQSPDGHALVYDAGSQPTYDMHRWTLAPFLMHERVYSIDRVIVSHPNLDHFSSVPDLVAQWPVGAVSLCPQFERLSPAGSASRRLLDDLASQHMTCDTLKRGDVVASGGGWSIEVLWPPAADVFQTDVTNDTSIVLSISLGHHRVLLCGDITEAAQQALIRRDRLRADVLVLPHHGSLARTLPAFLNAVHPIWCIRSSGTQDQRSKPELLDLMSPYHYFNTAHHGSIEIRMSADTLDVIPFRP